MKPKPIDWSVRWLAEKINKTRPRKGSKQWPTTKTWPSIEIPLPTRRNTLHTHTDTLRCKSTNKLGFTPSFCDDTQQHLVLQQRENGDTFTNEKCSQVREKKQTNKRKIFQRKNWRLCTESKNNRETSVERDDQSTTNTQKLAYTEAPERLAHARALHYAPSGASALTDGGATDGSQVEKNTRRRI